MSTQPLVKKRVSAQLSAHIHNRSALPAPLHLTLSGALSAALGLALSVGCTESNPSFEACLLKPYACTTEELCDGIDGDGDGVIDEGLAEPCALFLPNYLSGSEGFGRSLAVMPDVNADGYDELLVGATLPLPILGGLAPSDVTGSVYLLNGASGDTLWAEGRDGLFGSALAVGDFDRDGELEFASSSAYAGDAGLVGVWFYEVGEGADVTLSARYLPDSPLGFGRALSVTKAQQPSESGLTGEEAGEALLVSQPLWGDAELIERGRLTALRLEGERAMIDHEFEGRSEGQRLGERFLCGEDLDGDGAPELLSTAWREREGVSERQVLLLNGATGVQLKQFSTEEPTQGTLGEGLAWGALSTTTEHTLAFSAPEIASTEESGPTKGRVYLVSPEGELIGTTGVEGRSYGSALLTIKRPDEDSDLLLVGGRGVLRVFGPDRTLIKELSLASDEVPTLAASQQRDPQGRYRVWVGLPNAGRVYQLGIK